MKNFSWLVSLNFLGYLFSFLTLPLLISKYGLKEMGVVFTVQVVVFGIATISNYSLVYYIPTISKSIDNDEVMLVENWNLTIATRSFLSITLGLFSLFIVYLFFNSIFYMWFVSLSILIPKIFNPTLFCNAIEKNKFVFTIGFFSKLLFLIFIYYSNSIEFINFYLAISELLVIVVFLPIISKNLLKIKFVGLIKVVAFLRQTFKLFLVNFFSHLKTMSILPFITFLLGSESATLYTLADKVMNVIRNISGGMFVSFFPIYNKEKFAMNFFRWKNVTKAILLSLVVVLFVWYLSHDIIFYLNNGVENQIATKTLQVFSVSIPMYFIVVPLFSYLLEWKKWNVILTVAIIQISALFFMIYFFHENIVETTIGIVISEYILLILYILYVYKNKS